MIDLSLGFCLNSPYYINYEKINFISRYFPWSLY